MNTASTPQRAWWPGASFRRVLLIQCVAMAVGWAVWVVNYWWRYTHVSEPDVPSLKSDLGMVAQAIADVAALTASDAERPRAIAARLEDFHGGYREMLRLRTDAFGYVLWHADGRVATEHHARAAWWPSPTPAPPDAAQRLHGGSARDDGGRELFTIRRASADGRFIAAAAVRRESLDAQLGVLLRATFLPTLWIVPFMLPTTLLIAWIATLPVRRLARAIGTREPGDLTPLPAQIASAEFTPVTQAVNRWLAALREARAAEARSRERERAFFANAAHELRTPLAAIGAHAHALERSGTGTAAAQALVASVARMGTLLDKLLLLARLDAQAHTEADAPIDLAALLRQRIAAFVPRALQHEQQLALDAPAAAPTRGQAEALHSVIDNLLENALRYTPRGGHVDVALVALVGEGSGWRITVDDNGPGIDPAERERVFERFYRVAGQDMPGTGLGLAIVRDAVHSHGGTVALDGSPLGGLRVTVSLPLRR